MAQPVVATVTLDGELDAQDLLGLADDLFRVVHRRTTRVVVDLSGVRHLDYRGVRPLAARVELLRRAGGDLKLAGVSPYLRAVLSAGGAHGRFELYDTVEEAQEAFDTPPLSYVA